MNQTLSHSVPQPDATVLQQMQTQGYVHVKGMFLPEEVSEIREMFSTIHREGVPGFYEPPASIPGEEVEPLTLWPRVMHPHRFNDRAKHYMIHPRVAKHLELFMGEPVVATQSMFYFKPPGAKGQAMHQDNYYLMVRPQTCMAAWTAIDYCDAENGGMMVVPGSHLTDLVCPEEANSEISFTRERVKLPKGLKVELVKMEPGDTLFFNGTLIHGSGPNRSKDRFRRSFICHYAPASSESISRWFNPVVHMDGAERNLAESMGGGPCGTEWAGAVH